MVDIGVISERRRSLVFPHFRLALSPFALERIEVVQPQKRFHVQLCDKLVVVSVGLQNHYVQNAFFFALHSIVK